MTNILIRTCLPNDEAAKQLVDELSNSLYEITGNNGRHSFAENDVQLPGSIFIVVVIGGESVGCGGIRPISEDVCELKRMYAKYTGRGIGHAILRELESFAIQYGYKEIWLETRIINQTAVAFYLKHGYRVRSNYGKYIGREEAVCFEKTLPN